MRYLTAGESHGPALVGIIEGIPAGLAIDAAYLHAQAKRRKLGFGRGNRQNIETDAIAILAGVRFGRTLGSPIALQIENRDWRSWTEIMSIEPLPDNIPVRRVVSIPRPGHADRIGGIKYAHGDMRNVLERASARETAMRVALGSVARRFLEEVGVTVVSRVVQIGDAIDDEPLAETSALETIDESPVRALGKAAEAKMVAAIEAAKASGDTLGGVIEVVARGVPVALGSYAQWDRRLEAEIGRTFLALNAIKGVEIGLGFGLAELPGSQAHDAFYPAAGEQTMRTEYRTNRAGGIDGGMTTGQPIVVRAAMKPLATLMKPLESVNLSTGEATKAHVERSDVCAVPAAAVIGESLLALVLAEAVLEKFGGDEMGEILTRVHSWKATVLDR
ncbi:MAG: chorismate synthase [Candidatus Eremiobacteraeota bacterium]|nr:chorismate synthase [Candidatus Eremiobacteraeota bacterium]MBV8355713.1 chorismate synthase [Candidatus Eremiobacteraeota bacterium]